MTPARNTLHLIADISFRSGMIICTCGTYIRISQEEIDGDKALRDQAVADAYADHKRVADPHRKKK